MVSWIQQDKDNTYHRSMTSIWTDWKVKKPTRPSNFQLLWSSIIIAFLTSLGIKTFLTYMLLGKNKSKAPVYKRKKNVNKNIPALANHLARQIFLDGSARKNIPILKMDRHHYLNINVKSSSKSFHKRLVFVWEFLWIAIFFFFHAAQASYYCRIVHATMNSVTTTLESKNAL